MLESWVQRSLEFDWRRRLAQWMGEAEVSESGVILFTALVIGIGSGLGAVLFRWLINGAQSLAYGQVAGLFKGMGALPVLIIPALGGAIYGPLIYRFAREAKGHGVPEVMEAVALRGGRIRPRVAIIKSLASAICIGTGGSVGREGPIAQIGSALGSTLGQWLHLSDDRVRNLVACGAAGGIAATFNAPIAGSIFALEVILGQFQTINFGAVVISATTASVITHVFMGDVRAFPVPGYLMVSPWELFFYTGLGIVAALVAVAFTRLLYLSEDLWNDLRIAEYVKPLLGGLALGIVGLLTYKIGGYPRVFGVGYDTITDALFGNLAVQVTLSLLFFKVLATIITLGAGGSGGIFAPSLFMGAMLGEAFGQGVHALFPLVTAPAGAYALVGMAAVFSGAAHAPITAIIILFEMTGDYHIILPLMLATVVSTLLSRIISRESIYTLKLTRRGVHLQQGQDIDVMQGISVSEAMTAELETVRLDMPLAELQEKFVQTAHHGFPVVDAAGRLGGIVSLQDLKVAQADGPLAGKTVADIATVDGLLVAHPEEPVWRALRRMGSRDIGRLPVVDRDDPRKLVGMVRRSDIIHAYDQAIKARAHHQHRAEMLRLAQLDGVDYVQIDIAPESPAVGAKVSALSLPQDCLIVSVRRGRALHLAHGSTVLQEGDRVVVLADRACAGATRQLLTGQPGEEVCRPKVDVPVTSTPATEKGA